MALRWEGSLVEALCTVVVADTKVVWLIEAKGGTSSTMELISEASKEISVDEGGLLEDFSGDLSLSAEVCRNVSTEATSLSVLHYNQLHNILPLLQIN